MKILNTVKEAIVGINLELSTQELIILKDMVEKLQSAINDSKENFRNAVRCDETTLKNLVTFTSKLVKEVDSMQECYNKLFDVEKPLVVNVNIGQIIDKSC